MRVTILRILIVFRSILGNTVETQGFKLPRLVNSQNLCFLSAYGKNLSQQVTQILTSLRLWFSYAKNTVSHDLKMTMDRTLFIKSIYYSICLRWPLITFSHILLTCTSLELHAFKDLQIHDSYSFIYFCTITRNFEHISIFYSKIYEKIRYACLKRFRPFYSGNRAFKSFRSFFNFL